ncbi:hypothetical protein BD413DRAFT_31716 [Trametes elegans]|nr:hypothetical protein BD413DRAFT_31716 [Trametes elegans]
MLQPTQAYSAPGAQDGTRNVTLYQFINILDSKYENKRDFLKNQTTCAAHGEAMYIEERWDWDDGPLPPLTADDLKFLRHELPLPPSPEFESVRMVETSAEPQLADELESIFHVLLYFGVRFMRHNCDRVPLFVEEYFRSRCKLDSTHTYCSRPKRDAVLSGSVVLAGTGPLRFFGKDDAEHPLNSVLATLQSWLKARYLGLPEIRGEVNLDLAGPPNRKRILPAGTSTEAAEAAAKKLSRHADILELLQQALSADWPSGDVVGNQLPIRPPSPASLITLDPGRPAEGGQEAGVFYTGWQFPG